MTLTPTEMREHRLNAGLSASAAAREISVPKRLILDLENGVDVRPHPANAKRLADFYGVKVTDLWPVDREDVPA